MGMILKTKLRRRSLASLLSGSVKNRSTPRIIHELTDSPGCTRAEITTPGLLGLFLGAAFGVVLDRVLGYSVMVSSSQLRPPSVLQSVDLCIKTARFLFVSILLMSF